MYRKFMYSSAFLTNQSHLKLPLSDVFADAPSLAYDIAECSSAKELRDDANRDHKHGAVWTIHHDDKYETVLTFTDSNGNTYYLTARKRNVESECLGYVSDFPDEALIMELASRGYKVSR